MNENDKIIYEKIARKDFSFGCMVTICINSYKYKGIIIDYVNNRYRVKPDEYYLQTSDYDDWDIEIIGNPILLSDVLNYINERGWNCAIGSTGKIMFNKMEDGSYKEVQWDLSKPCYEEQSEECKDFIRNLCK